MALENINIRVRPFQLRLKRNLHTVRPFHPDFRKFLWDDLTKKLYTQQTKVKHLLYICIPKRIAPAAI